MKAIKIFGGIIFLVIVIVVGIVFYVLGNINQLVKEGVETVGPKVTNTSVLLDDVNIKLFKGRGELNDFVIGNPEGYKSSHLLRWDQIALEIDPKSINTGVIMINDVTIRGVNIKAEQKGFNTNLQDLMKTLQSKAGSGDTNTEDSRAASEGPDIRLAMKNMIITGNSIDFITEKFGQYNLKIPSVEVSNIGDPNVGLTPEQFGIEILKPLVKAAQDAVEDKVRDLGIEELQAKLLAKKEELKGKVDAEKERVKQQIEDEKQRLEEQENKLTEEKEEVKDEASKKVEDKLKGLLGG